MELLANTTALVGGAMVLVRRMGALGTQAVRPSPDIPDAKSQGIMTLKMPAARSGAPGKRPKAATGLRVDAFARDLQYPRWIEVLPNGDVLMAEAL